MARAPVSKTGCCGFESHRTCHLCVVSFRIASLFSTFGICFSVIKGYKNAMFKRLAKFLREVKVELKKVSWPSRREISGSTGVVIVTVLIVAIYLGIVDNILQQIMMRIH